MRRPAVAGSFYPAQKAELGAQIAESLSRAGLALKLGNARDIAAAVCPHAGYMYSGWVAAFSYSRIAAAFSKPPVFVIVGPNHTGQGSPVALSQQDWDTPLGIAKNDAEFGKEIVKCGTIIDLDERAHEFEHSIEVQLPFLQKIYGERLRIVPICLGMQNMDSAKDIAEAVQKASARLKREAFIIASSDFTHFESAESAKMHDAHALDALKRLDEGKFFEQVRLRNLTICGYGPILSAMHYARLEGCRKAEILKYANSGDVTGDHNSVVAYCSAVFPLG